MKPPYDSNSETHAITGSARERGMHAVNARPPPAVHYRRYPSLSDDGQPYFPRLRRARHSANERAPVMNSANESHASPFFSVRLFALLAIVALIAALAARG
jgi:hypothetical protein